MANLKVRQLVEMLQTLDQDAEIYLHNPNGCREYAMHRDYLDPDPARNSCHSVFCGDNVFKEVGVARVTSTVRPDKVRYLLARWFVGGNTTVAERNETDFNGNERLFP